MKKALAIVLVPFASLVFSACGSDQEVTQTIDVKTSAIVGGVQSSELPAVGALVYDGMQHCTATVIGPRLVLTAAHCVTDVSASRMQFVMGGSIFKADAAIQIKQLYAHSGFSFYDYPVKDDIGLAVLAEDAPVEPLPVSTEAMDASWVGQNLLFVGYGITDGIAQGGSGLKRYVTMPVTGVANKTFSYGSSGKSTCSGDSGGPALRRVGEQFQVVGVTSYGDRYCRSGAVDTRVDAYLSFIGLQDQAPDACQGETYEGRCTQGYLLWCENNEVKYFNCQENGYQCGLSTKGYYTCLR